MVKSSGCFRSLRPVGVTERCRLVLSERPRPNIPRLVEPLRSFKVEPLRPREFSLETDEAELPSCFESWRPKNREATLLGGGLFTSFPLLETAHMVWNVSGTRPIFMERAERVSAFTTGRSSGMEDELSWEPRRRPLRVVMLPLLSKIVLAIVSLCIGHWLELYQGTVQGMASTRMLWEDTGSLMARLFHLQDTALWSSLLPYTNIWLLLYKFEAINKTEVALYVSFFGSFCWNYKECCSYFAPRRRVGLLFQLFHLVYVAALYVLPRKMPEFRWALDIISLCIYRSSFLFWNLTLSFDCRLAVNFSWLWLWIQRFTRKETLFDNCSSINQRENEMRSFDKSRRGKPLWHVLTELTN